MQLILNNILSNGHNTTKALNL